jgi:hypothetical protein
MDQNFNEQGGEEAQASSRGNAARKRKSRVRREAQKSSQESVSDPALLALKDAWKSLSIVERGKRLTPFTERYSLRRLARVLDCSEARIRQLLDLAKLPPDAERDFCEGRIGVKKALRLVRGLRANDRYQRLTSTDETHRQKLIESGAALIVKWILQLLPETYALQFLGIVQGEERGPAGEIFLKLMPKPYMIRVNSDPMRVIRRCRPKYTRPEYGPYLLNYSVEWWAAWGPRVMPDPRIRGAAVAAAERCLYRRVYEGGLAG